MLTVNSTINLAGQAVPNIIPAVQGDTGRVIVFTLADFTIPAGSTATYYVQKPSGEAVYNSATIDSNKVTVELTAQSLAETGDNYGQVRILNGEDVVTSFDFILLVKPFRGIGAIESSTEMNIFDEAVQNAMANIDGMLPNIIAPVFDTSTTYAAGDYVIYSGKLYQFTSAHAAGAWTGTDAEECTVAEDISQLKEDIGDLSELETTDKSSLVSAINEANQHGGGSGLTEDMKQALLACFEQVAWIGDDGQDYYDALEEALYPPANLVRITAVYTQSGTVTDWDTLESLKADLVVTAHFEDSTTQTVTTYALSGSLTEGTSVITVTYGGLSTTFNVTVTHSDLPAGYTQYDYIEMTDVPTSGTAARYYTIITDAQMHSDYTLETEVGFGANRVSNINFEPFFGARNGGSGQLDFVFYARSSNGQIKFILNGNEMTLTSPTLPTTANYLNKIKYLPVGASESHPNNNVLAVNGAEYNTNLAVSDTEFSPWFGFFAYATAASGYSSATVYYRGYVIGITEIKDQNGNLVYKFIPAKNSDDIYGFFETVHSKFYYNNYNDGALLSHYTGGNLEG